MNDADREPRILDPRAEPGWIDRAREVIRAGGIVALPTETFYGLAVDPGSEAAVHRLLALKGYGRGRALLLLAADEAQADEVAVLRDCPPARRLAARFWPGPLTLVLSLRRPSPAGPGGTIAIRVPDSPWPRELAAACGHPVTGTSANRGSAEPAIRAVQVAAALPSVDLILDGGDAPGGAPSTLLDLGGDEPTLLRPGPVELAAIEATLRRAGHP